MSLTPPSVTRSGKVYKMTDKISLTVSPAFPAFSEQNPRAWFRRAESRFSCAKITTDLEKTDRVLEALPVTVFDRLAPWLETQSDEIKYDDLKKELLSYYVDSKQRRTQEILDLVTQPTDNPPSNRWRRINALLTSADGTQMNLAWELWVHSLPPQVRAILQDADSKDQDAIIKRADTLQHQLAPTNASASAVHESTQRPRKDRRPPLPKKDEEIKDGQCWFHRCFGERAHRCLSGCKHFKTKNGNSGHQ